MNHNKVSLALSPVLLALVWQVRNEPLAVCVCISLLAGLATWCAVPAASETFKRVGLSGIDLSKPSQPRLAESMGVLVATIYLIATFLFIPAQFHKWIQDPQQTSSKRVFPFDRLGDYLSALLSLQSMVFLGFADDVFDLRWRYKLFLPTIASIPVLIVYYVGYGVTHVVLPKFVIPWLGTNIVDLGVLYYVYIGMMAVFCTNAINILAGINGVEVGQSIVIALSIIVKDIANINNTNVDAEYNHLFSLYLLLPFIAVSTALYYWNVYPARVFVGDTYCYFAGMTFAVCGILGHFSKTLLLLFIPQVFNFVYSAPQIFGLVPCPRHRLPKMRVGSPISKSIARRLSHAGNKDADSSLYETTDSEASTPDPVNRTAKSTDGHLKRTISYVMLSFSLVKQHRSKQPSTFGANSKSKAVSGAPIQSGASTYMIASRASLNGAKPLGLKFIQIYESLGLADVEYDEDGNAVSVNNLTLLNLVLIKNKRLTEAQLNNRILMIQALNSLLAFFIRYRLSHVFY